MKKRLLALISAVLGSAVCAFGLSACGGDGSTGGNPSGGNPSGGDPTHTHTMTYHEGEEATCVKDGNLEFWECTDCGKNFADKEGEKELSDITIYAEGHKATFNEQYSEDCTVAGTVAHWHCEVCNKDFADEKFENEIFDLVLPPQGHKTVFVGGTPSSCTQDGEAEHWNCTVCGKNFEDEDGTVEINGVTLPSGGHSMEFTAAKEATCTDRGNIDFYFCSVCENYYTDRDGYNQILEHVVFTEAFGHEEGRNLTYSEGREPHCFGDGMKPHYYCYMCDKYFLDLLCENEVAEEDLIIPTTGHAIEFVPEEPADCENRGVREHYYCPLCTGKFSDAEGLEMVFDEDLATDPTDHPFDESEWTYDEREHWRAPLCNHIYQKGDLGNHEFEGRVCKICRYERNEPSPDERTVVDNGLIYEWYNYGSCYLISGVDGDKSELTSVTLIEEVNGFPVNGVYGNPFEGCTALSKVYVPSLEWWAAFRVTEKVFYAPYTMYIDGNPLVNLVIPVGAENTGDYANCISIKTATIPESAWFGEGDTYVSVFSGCTSLESVTLPYAYSERSESFNIGQLFGSIHTDYNDQYVPASLKKIIVSGGDRVGDYFLANMKTVESVEISESVREIRGYAFSGCSGLKGVSLPEQLEKIGNGAFLDCALIKEIVIPETVTKIAAYEFGVSTGAFEGCSALESMTLPAVFTQFASLFGHVYGSTDNVPDSLKKVDVIGSAPVGDAAFKDCTGLESVTLSREITSVGAEAFYSCDSLKSIKMDGIVNLGKSAFVGCDALADVNLGNSLKIIPEEAFAYSGLTSFVIPASVTEIRNRAFFNCLSLADVDLGNVSKIMYQAFDYCAIKEIYIPDTVKELQSSALGRALTKVTTPSLEAWLDISFYGDNPLLVAHNLYIGDNLLTELEIPEDIKSINEYAFAGCTSITKITLPAGFEKISEYAFYNCESLEAICIDNLNDWFEMQIEHNPLQYAGNLYVGGELLTDLVVPSSVRTVNKWLFMGCDALESVILEEGVEVIDFQAFGGCSSLKSVETRGGLKKVESYAFYNCNSLKNADLGNSLESVGDCIFFECNSLESLSMPAVKIPARVYSGATDYEDVYSDKFGYLFNDFTISQVPSTLTTLNITGGSEIGEQAFRYFSSLNRVTVADSVNKIGYGAFADCTELTYIKLPFAGAEQGGTENTHFGYIFGNNKTAQAVNDNSQVPLSLKTVEITAVTKLGGAAFASCEGIARVILPDGVTEIGAEAFKDCALLEDINLTEQLVSIGDRAFYNCPSLAIELDLSENVTKVGVNAFAKCNSLKTVRLSGNISVAAISETAFNKCQIETVETPAALCAYFDKAYLKSLKLLDGETVAENAFKDYLALETVILPESVIYIERYAFTGCISLTEVSLPEGLLSVGEYAFENCGSLMEITLPVSLESIADYTFKGCFALTAYYSYNGNVGHNIWNGDWNVVSETETISGTVKRRCPEQNLCYNNYDEYYVVVDGVRYVYNVNGNTAEIVEQAAKSVNIHIPATITVGKNDKVLKVSSVKDGAFDCLTLLESFTVDSENNYFASQDGILYDRLMDNALWVPQSIRGEVTLPSHWTTVPQDMFKDRSKLSGVVLHEGIIAIGNGAFDGCASLLSFRLPSGITEVSISNCASLKTVYLPNTVISINVSAFTDCPALESIEVEEGCSAYCSKDGVLYRVFDDGSKEILTVPKSIKGRVVLEKVRTIDENVFADCTLLESIEITDLIAIRVGAFENCTSLKEIFIFYSSEYPSVPSLNIRENAFKGCTALEKVYFKNIDSLNNLAIESGNDCFKSAVRYVYADPKPDYEGNFWHYVDGEITIW